MSDILFEIGYDAFDLAHAHAAGGMRNLAMQIRQLDGVAVYKA